MSQSTTPKVTSPSPSQPPKGEGEWPGIRKPQDWSARASKLVRNPVVGSEDVSRLQGEIENLKKLLDRERSDSQRLRWEKGKLNGECMTKNDRIMNLEENIRKMRGTMERQIQHIRMVEERLKQGEGPPETRTAELSATQTFLSTTDRVSEAEVLSIVRSLNEVIYQVAVKLTEEWEKLELWEKLEPWEATERIEVDRTTRPRVSPLVQLVRDRNPTGLTFQLQSCLCSEIVSMTSARSRFQGFAGLESVYERLSASEGQGVSARWRSLAYSNLSRPPPPSVWLGRQVASALDDTGSFLTSDKSLDFVRFAAREGIESIIRLMMRLELVFMEEIESSNMSLLFEGPGVVFDDARMTDEFGYGDTHAHESENRVAGTTEVGLAKSVCGGPGESRFVEILSKTKVVLEKDIVEVGE